MKRILWKILYTFPGFNSSPRNISSLHQMTDWAIVIPGLTVAKISNQWLIDFYQLLIEIPIKQLIKIYQPLIEIYWPLIFLSMVYFLTTICRQWVYWLTNHLIGWTLFEKKSGFWRLSREKECPHMCGHSFSLDNLQNPFSFQTKLNQLGD